MPNLLKNIYSPQFYDRFTDVAAEVIPSLDKQQFTKAIFDKNWEAKELKERMKHTTLVLHQFLPSDFPGAAQSIEQIILKLRQNRFTESSLEFMFFPDYIETYGLEHFETSVKAFEFVTQFTSCEFAVRPFVAKYGDRMIKEMHRWSQHENHHVRRLASEGSRPRLPWAMALPTLKKNPTAILPLLENLKNDPSEYVRRSVANSLNDIAKDNPHIVVKIAKQWKNTSKETDALVKHACRTLLKQGHPEILEYYGLLNSTKLEVSGFKIATPKVPIGGDLRFSFTLKNQEKQPQTLRIEYGVHYLRQNGQLSKKVFKISERVLAPNDALDIERKQSFRLITTRRFYPGLQKLSIIINGHERQIGDFELTQ